MSDHKNYPWQYRDWNTCTVSSANAELGLFAKLYLWVDGGMVQTVLSCDENDKPLVRESFVVGHLESAALYELLDVLHWMVSELCNETIAEALVPVGASQVKDWLLTLLHPNKHQWAIAALVAAGLKGSKVCSLKEAFRAIFWGAVERAAFCERLGISEAEFKGSYKVACKAASPLIEFVGLRQTLADLADWAVLA